VRSLLLILLVLTAGCRPASTQHIDLLCECFAIAAYEAVAAEQRADVPAEHKCCGECGKKGLPKGKVLSGDGISVVPCPCPDSCECKKK